MKNILFLNSYSKQAATHYRYALRLALRLEATLHLAHIYDFRDNLKMNRNHEPFGELKSDEWLEKVQKEETKVLEEFVGKNTSKQHFQLIGEILAYEGSATEEIPKLLEAAQYDLVIMGMQEHLLLSQLLETNLTQYLVDTIKYPLLLLPRDGSNFSIKRICLASDLAAESQAAVNYVFDLSLKLKADFHLLTVLPSDADIVAASDRIEELQGGIHGGYSSKLYFSIEVGDPEKKIKAHHKDEALDLLVVTTRQRKRWIDQFEQTITKALVREAKIPLLVLKEEYVEYYRIL